jgi:lysozyme
MTAMHNGIDVSGFQGSPDFQKVESAGNRFVYIKATEGADFVDSGFRSRQRDACAAGLHTGFYHFLRPRSDRSGAEADNFWRNVNGVKGGENGAELLRLAADIEVSTFTRIVNGRKEVDPGPTMAYVRQFLDRLEKIAGHEPIVYTFPEFILRWDTSFKDYRLWIAHFGAKTPSLPAPWTEWAAWQYTSTGSVPGVSGNVDRNKCPVLSELILERDEY